MVFKYKLIWGSLCLIVRMSWGMIQDSPSEISLKSTVSGNRLISGATHLDHSRNVVEQNLSNCVDFGNC